MNLFSTALLLTLFHSLWQSLLIWIYIYLDGFFYQHQSPNTKTQKLFFLLGIQLFTSCVTFFIIYNKSDVTNYGNSIVTKLFSFNNFMTQIGPYLTAAYFIMLILKSTITLVKWIKFKKAFMSQLVKTNVDIKLFTHQKSFELGIKRKIKIWYSNNINSPVTFGHFKPVILLPLALMSKLSIEETEALIIHELTHIKNNDFLFNWFLIVSEHLYYFNPFIKRICNQVRWERELRCDLQVLHYNYKEVTYAESLFKAAISEQTNTSNMFLAAVSSRFSLLKRIEFFTTHHQINNKPSRFQQASFSISIFVLTLLLITSVYLNVSSPEKKAIRFSNQISTSKVAKPISNNNAIAVRNDLIIENKSSKKITAKKVNYHTNTFLIEHKKLPITHNSIQNDINIDLLKENEAVSFISQKETAKNEKQIFVKEENPATGEIVTKSYQLIKNNGIWESTLLWIITEKPIDLNSKKANNSEHSVQ